MAYSVRPSVDEAGLRTSDIVIGVMVALAILLGGLLVALWLAA